MKEKLKAKYHGITYDGKIDASKWKGCKQHMHLFDEVLGAGREHYLHCDTCGLTVEIKKITDPIRGIVSK